MSLSRLLHLEALAFVYTVAFVVAYGLLTSRINMKGLLSDKSGSGAVRPERVQLLLATLAFAASYVAEVSHTNLPAFPNVDASWLYLFGGSSGIYIARKAYEVFSVSQNQR